jgi:hypothetical protein
MGKKKISLYPSFSLKFGLVHLFIGNEKCDGRRIFVLVEELEEARFEVKLHWLITTEPMFGLFLWPTFCAYLFWCASHTPVEAKEE